MDVQGELQFGHSRRDPVQLNNPFHNLTILDLLQKL